MTDENGANRMLLAGFPYKVRSHEHVDDDFVRVTLHCIGYPTKGAHPAELDVAFLVPAADVKMWPLGSVVRLEVMS